MIAAVVMVLSCAASMESATLLSKVLQRLLLACRINNYLKGDSASKDRLKAAQAETPRFPEAVELEHIVDEPRQLQPPASTEFIDKTSSFVDSRELFVQRQLTINDLKDYAKRTYHRAPTTDWMASASDHAAANK